MNWQPYGLILLPTLIGFYYGYPRITLIFSIAMTYGLFIAAYSSYLESKILNKKIKKLKEELLRERSKE